MTFVQNAIRLPYCIEIYRDTAAAELKIEIAFLGTFNYSMVCVAIVYERDKLNIYICFFPLFMKVVVTLNHIKSP